MTDDDPEEVRVPEGGQVALDVSGVAEDVDPENITNGMDAEKADNLAIVSGQANDDSMTVNPIAETETHRLGGHFSDVYNEYGLIRNDKIQKLRDNRVDYNERVGKWILEQDDRVPAVLNNQVGLILGQDGLQVEPEDPDSEADQQTADFLRDMYNGELDDEPHVNPRDVVRAIMAQNYLAARSVVRSTDLAELPLDTLTYYRDPENSTEYYIQDGFSYRRLIDEGDGDYDTERESTDEQLLEVGTHVFDAHLFRSKPLKSIADLVVNKMVLQRLMARKAEIASVGGLYIEVSPPEYLSENEYGDTIEDPNNSGETISKLELYLREDLNDAFDTLQDYQSGFIMSIPSHWEVQQIEVPDTGEPMKDQIRTYNQSIAARLMFPLDLMELREGSELSRDTIFRALLNTISGWRGEVLNVFDDFADVQKDIHNLSGNVTHTLPKLETEDESLLIQALNFAGLAGMTSKEVRQTFNRIEGFDLDDEPEGEPVQQGPPPGGPSGPDRDMSMRDMLDLGDEDEENEQEPSPDDEDDGAAVDGAAAKFTPPEGLDMHELEGWDQTSVWRAYISLGASHSSCSKRMATEVRNADAWCAALKDQALGTDLWRTGSGAFAGSDAPEPTVSAEATASYNFGGSLSSFADTVRDVLEENMDSDIMELESDDDFVAFSPGGVDPTEDEDVDDSDFSPVVVVKSGENEYRVNGASDDDLSGLETALGEAMAASRPFDVPDDVASMSTSELIDGLSGGE